MEEKIDRTFMTKDQVKQWRKNKEELPMAKVTDGILDDDLLFYYENYCPTSLTNKRKVMTDAERETMNERWGMRHAGFTLSQKIQLQSLTNGEFKIEDYEYGY